MNVDGNPNFRFALHKDDCVKIYKDAHAKKIDKDGEIFRIDYIEADDRITIRHHTDARVVSRSKKEEERAKYQEVVNEYQEKYGVEYRQTLKKWHTRLVKVEVDVLGNVTLPEEIY